MTTYLIQKGDASKRLPDLRSPTSVLKVDGRMDVDLDGKQVGKVPLES